MPKRVWAGSLGCLGWGLFQVYDGLFQHKVLGLHQTATASKCSPYDLAWNLSGAVGAVYAFRAAVRPGRSIAVPPGGP